MNFKKIFSILLAITLFFALSGEGRANGDYALTGQEAFSGKNLYYSNAVYNNRASYASHKSAFNFAVSKMNAIPYTSINLYAGAGTKANPLRIDMSSVNSASYDWYGQAAYNSGFATLRINEDSTSDAGFIQSNYNKTAMHELAHAFYARHQHSSVSSVMKQGKYSYSDYTTLDKSNFGTKY